MQVSESITQRSSSNLAMAFIVLPKSRRRDMAALYAFCREVDDVADDESVPAEIRQARLNEWRVDIKRACDGGRPVHPVNQELQEVIHRHHLDEALFEELIKGVEMDLTTTRYESYETLELYCYRVASVVGLLSIEIFGYRNPNCRNYAVHLGKALQLTNILRDVGNDAARGRIYIPDSELSRFNVPESDIQEGRHTRQFQLLASSIASRAREHYRAAKELLPPEDRRAMISAELMGAVYWSLLQKLEREKFRVLGPSPTRLNKALKLTLILRAWLRNKLGSHAPNYG